MSINSNNPIDLSNTSSWGINKAAREACKTSINDTGVFRVKFNGITSEVAVQKKHWYSKPKITSVTPLSERIATQSNTKEMEESRPLPFLQRKDSSVELLSSKAILGEICRSDTAMTKMDSCKTDPVKFAPASYYESCRLNVGLTEPNIPKAHLGAFRGLSNLKTTMKKLQDEAYTQAYSEVSEMLNPKVIVSIDNKPIAYDYQPLTDSQWGRIAELVNDGFLDVNFQYNGNNRRGMHFNDTLLHVAANTNRHDMMQLLIKKGANQLIENSSEQTASDLIKGKENRDMTDL
jgi:hypothetical protein